MTKMEVYESLDTPWILCPDVGCGGCIWAGQFIELSRTHIELWANCVETALYLSWDKCSGEFKVGKLDGQGSYAHAKGYEYVCEYKEGKRNGQFTLFEPFGSSMLWYIDSFVSHEFNDHRPRAVVWICVFVGNGTKKYPMNGAFSGEGVL